jgi:hypothetical protein
MNGEIEQATQFCEERKVNMLSTLVPKIVDPNAIVFLMFAGICVSLIFPDGIVMAK